MESSWLIFAAAFFAFTILLMVVFRIDPWRNLYAEFPASDWQDGGPGLPLEKWRVPSFHIGWVPYAGVRKNLVRGRDNLLIVEDTHITMVSNLKNISNKPLQIPFSHIRNFRIKKLYGMMDYYVFEIVAAKRTYKVTVQKTETSSLVFAEFEKNLQYRTG